MTQAEILKYENDKKSAATAYLLWFFLGGIGVHRFYFGDTGGGIVGIVLTIFSIGVLVSGVYSASGPEMIFGIACFVIHGIWLSIEIFTIPEEIRKRNNELLASLNAVAVLPVLEA